MSEKAILIGVITPEIAQQQANEYLDELAFLADTAGAETIETITQKIQRINPAFYIGKGKVAY